MLEYKTVTKGILTNKLAMDSAKNHTICMIPQRPEISTKNLIIGEK